jgi:hypothetical protein
MLIKYDDLTDEQKRHVAEVFYDGRKMHPNEYNYSYFFKDGVCEYAE